MASGARIIALLILAALAVGAVPGHAAASCWASNPDGTRICADYQKPGVPLIEHLCEDASGDCAKLGYEPAVTPAQSESAETSNSDDDIAPATDSEASTNDALADPPADDESSTNVSQETPGQRAFVIFMVGGLGVALLLFLLAVMLKASGYPAFGAALTWLAGGVAAVWLLIVVVVVSMMVGAADSERRKEAG